MPDNNSLEDQYPLPGKKNRFPSGCAGSVFWASLAAVLSVAIAAVVVLVLQERVTAESRAYANKIAERFEKTFQFRPEVRIDGIVVIEPQSPVLEVATVRRDLLARHRWSHTHLFSTKQFEIEAPFVARAGFDLRETPLRLDIDPTTGAVRTDLPSPKILSLEMGDPKILRDENGFWNKMTSEDRERAFRALRGQAEEEIAKSSILHDAKIEAETLIRETLEGRVRPPEAIPQPSP